MNTNHAILSAAVIIALGMMLSGGFYRTTSVSSDGYFRIARINVFTGSMCITAGKVGDSC
jgi:hypothetical protein